MPVVFIGFCSVIKSIITIKILRLLKAATDGGLFFKKSKEVCEQVTKIIVATV